MIYINAEMIRSRMDMAGFSEEYINHLIGNLSPTDVIEVKHGEWLDGNRQTWNGTYWFIYCSECLHERKDDNHDNDTPFCPNCGADMKGGVDNG